MRTYRYYAIVEINLPLTAEKVCKGTVRAETIINALMKAHESIANNLKLFYKLEQCNVTTVHVELN